MAECRICFEDASFNELIAPCLCNGTSRYVHRRCLERWRQSSSGAFSRCYECNFSYSLAYQYPVEHFKFNINYLLYNFERYLLAISAIFISSLYLRSVGKALHYPSLTALNFDQPYDRDNFIKVIQDDDINSVCYYFSLNNFLSSVICYGIFVLFTFWKIKRRLLYWKLLKIQFIFHAFFSYHFLWLYWMIGSTSGGAFDFFVVTDFALSMFNLATFMSLLNMHNVIIGRMNTKYNLSKVIAPPLQPPESIV
jgi:hypothetical protein